MTPPSGPTPRWRTLYADGIAHAFTSRQPTARSVCDKPNQEERYDYKRRSACEVCRARLAEQEGRLV